MVDGTLEHQITGLTGRALTIALFAKYGGLGTYGIWAALVEVPTFVIVGSPGFALVWAISVTVFAVFAACGVARTWLTGRFRFEKWSTAAFVLSFIAYSYALVYRAFTTENWASAPLAVIPVVVCILPTIRFYSLVKRRQAS